MDTAGALRISRLVDTIRGHGRRAARDDLQDCELAGAVVESLAAKVGKTGDGGERPTVVELVFLTSQMAERIEPAKAMILAGVVPHLVGVLGDVDHAPLDVRADACLALLHMSLSVDVALRDSAIELGVPRSLGQHIGGPREGTVGKRMREKIVETKVVRYSRYCSMCGRRWCYRCQFQRLQKYAANRAVKKKPAPRWVDGKIGEDEMYGCINRLYGHAIERENERKEQNDEITGIPKVYVAKFAPARLKFTEHNPHAEGAMKINGNFVSEYIPTRPRSAPQRRETSARLYYQSIEDRIEKTQKLYDKYEKKLDAKSLLVQGKSGRYSAFLSKD